jgi:DNA-binding transcriptional MocR family regulator
MERLGSRPSLADEIATLLRTKILSGELKPDERIGVSAAARDLGVSHIPVREAIQRLTAESLVESVHNQAPVVAGSSPARSQRRHSCSAPVIRLGQAFRNHDGRIRDVTARPQEPPRALSTESRKADRTQGQRIWHQSDAAVWVRIRRGGQDSGEVGDPARLRSKGSFAMLIGTAPLEASSGRTMRHRLNRGG